MKKPLDFLVGVNHKRLVTPLIYALGLLALSSTHAAGLGKMRVLSTLGGTFSAEIELVNVSPEEEGNLSAKVALPDVFKSSGLDYNPALSVLNATINKNSRPFKIILSSETTVSEPLLEILLELSWQSGRLVRQYTVLLDPSNPVNDTPAALDAGQAATPQVANHNATGIPTSTVTPVNSKLPSTSEVGASKKPKAHSGSDKEYAVQKGDTLYAIANKLAIGDSEQINQLMSLLVRSNPDAFVNNNKNRLKAGVVLDINAVSEMVSAGAVSGVKAIPNLATSKDFSKYKQAAAVTPKSIKDAGDSKLIRSSVKGESVKPLVVSQDQLRVAGKAEIGNKALPATGKVDEVKIARDRAIAEEKTKIAVLNHTIKNGLDIESNVLSNVAKPVKNTTPITPIPPSSVTPAISVTNSTPLPIANTNSSIKTPVIDNPAVVVTAAPVNNTINTNINNSNTNTNINSVPPKVTPEPTTTTIVTKPIESVNVVKPVTTPTTDTTVVVPNKPTNINNKPNLKPVVDELNWYENMNSMTLGGIVAVLALLGGGFMYKRNRDNKQKDFSDSTFSQSDTQGTMLTVDGGQAVDTFNSVFASSFSEVHTPESVEVDPVAEADVYMQYGRDVHAEDILKDSLKQTPDRLPVRLKLMELYVNQNKQNELLAQFEAISKITNSSGKDWLEAKRILNNVNATPAQTDDTISGINIANTSNTSNTGSDKNSVFAASDSKSTVMKSRAPHISLSSPTQIGDVPTKFNISTNTEAKFEPKAQPKPKVETPPSPVNLMATVIKPPPTKEAVRESSALSMNDAKLNFDIQKPTLFAAPSPNNNPLPTKLSVDSGIDFNLSKFGLRAATVFDNDKSFSTTINTTQGESTINSMQAIETKFSLAQAYVDIGDKDGAKELLQEVIESGNQSLIIQAKALLAKI